MIQALSTQKEQWPSPRVKCIQNGGFPKGEECRGEWQTKVVSVIPEMECNRRRDIADLGLTRPRTTRKRSAPHRPHQLCEGPNVLALGMVSALPPTFFPITN